MIRSMPMQFWPADWKTPRRRTEAIFESSRGEKSSRMRAGSLPPNSTQTGVRAFAAEAQTACATGREPMNVMCEIEGWEVRWEAVFGQHTRGWMRLALWPQAVSAVRTMVVK